MNALTDIPAIDDTLSINKLAEETDPKVDSAESQDSKPALDINFLALDGSPIAKMGVAVRWQGGELLARTDADGAIPPVEAPSGKTLSIAVQRFDGSYKKIGECCMPSSDGILTGISPNIVLETTTEKHEGKPGCAEERIPKPEQRDLGDLSALSSTQASPIDSPPPASGPETAEPASTTATPTTQPKKLEAPTKKPSAKPKVQSKAAEPKAKQQTDKPPQHISGKNESKPKLERGRDENGNPLVVITQKALDWWNSWRMPTFNLWGPQATGKQGGTVPVTPVKVDTEMLKKVEALLEFAREQTEYLYTEGTARVLASMGNGTFKHVKEEKENWSSRGLCYSYVKVALSRSRIVDGVLDGASASKAGPSLIANGFKDVTAEVPDGRWAAAGDVIVYEWTDATWEKRKKKDPNMPNHGHIDIRDYEFYISDFIPKFEPKNFLGRPTWIHYQNIRIYRKVFDLLPTLRIRAFLRCIREFECQAEHDDAKRYQMLNYPPPGNSGSRFSDYATHPWNDFTPPSKPHSTAAGAYQILHSTWKEIFDNGLIVPKGDRFSPAVQDRIAVMKLEDHAALHLVRTGNIQEAIGKLTFEWTSLPGGKQNAHRLTVEKKPMDMAYFKSLFETYLEEERKKA